MSFASRAVSFDYPGSIHTHTFIIRSLFLKQLYFLISPSLSLIFIIVVYYFYRYRYHYYYRRYHHRRRYHHYYLSLLSLL